jgi:hypothetical protein
MQMPNVGQVAAKPLMRIFRVPAQTFDLVGLYPQICLHSELLLDLRPETIYDWIWSSDGLKVCINKPRIPNLTIIGLPFEGQHPQAL